MIELEVKVVGQNEEGGYTILLVDKNQKYVLPIAVGPAEAHAIAMPFQGTKFPRPLTHDLMLSLCSRLGTTLKEVIITDIRDDTYFAEVHLQREDEMIILDARPSDAIALAVRAEVPIYMANRLVEFTMDFQDILFEDNNPKDEGLH